MKRFKLNYVFCGCLFTLLCVVLYMLQKFIPTIYLILLLIFFLTIFIATFFTVRYLDLKALNEKRKRKRDKALEKAGQFIKLYTNSFGTITINNRKLAVRYDLKECKIQVYGLLKSSNSKISFTADSNVKYLADDVWDYICNIFDRSTEISDIFYICLTNCLNIVITTLPKNISKENAIREFLNECKLNPNNEYGKDMKIDINIASEGELTSIEKIGEVLAKKIVKKRQICGPVKHYNELISNFNIPRNIVKEITLSAYISKDVLNRSKFEQSFDLL